MAWPRHFHQSMCSRRAGDTGAASWAYALFKVFPAWLPYGLTENFRKARRHENFKIACLPDHPRPWHSLQPIIKRAGGQIVAAPEHADAVFFFDERTRSKPPSRPDPLVPDFNFRCVDTSESRVARDFHIIFGYPLALKPERHDGPMVMKSEVNGRRDARIIDGPVLPEPGFAYQKLIDNRRDHRYAEIFSCQTVRGEIPLVYIIRRPLKKRFTNRDKTASLAKASDVFSPDELLKIRYFCAAIGLDWGSLDILRDNDDGRIYIVDVNKTDIGPPLALPLRDKLRATDILAERLSLAVLTVDNLSDRAEPPMDLAS